MMLSQSFFDQDPVALAQSLIGKVLRHRIEDPLSGPCWLSASIIETEAYYRTEKGSHSSRGYTEKRRAMFMAPGTIYMYYARGSDSLNFSARGKGNGVLIKSGKPFFDQKSRPGTLEVMHRLNPVNGRRRHDDFLCSGQTLLCRSLGLKVTEWNARQMTRGKFYLEDVGYRPDSLVRTTRLGIPAGRDEMLPYRFVDHAKAAWATRNPLKNNPHPVRIIENRPTGDQGCTGGKAFR